MKPIDTLTLENRRKKLELPPEKASLLQKTLDTKEKLEDASVEMFRSFLKFDRLTSVHRGAILLNNHSTPAGLVALTEEATAPYDLMVHALLTGASAVVLGRNAPDDDFSLTEADKQFMQKASEAAGLFGIYAVVMFVVGKTRVEGHAMENGHPALFQDSGNMNLKYHYGRSTSTVIPLIERNEIVASRSSMPVILPETAQEYLVAMDGSKEFKAVVAEVFNKIFGLAKSTQEHFVLMGFKKGKPDCVAMVGKGTNTEVSAAPREIMTHCLLAGVDAVIVAHNHPSGILKPSDPDVNALINLFKIGQLFSIDVLDMLILGTDEENKPIHRSMVHEKDVVIG